MKSLLATVIIPAYNTEDYIKDCLDCVINQTYKNLEIIVIDDGSTDNTKKEIEKYKKLDSRINLISIKNAGVSNARNLGIEKANGEKIFFFDSDDTFELDLIEKCLKFSIDNNVETVLYGYCDKINGKICNPHKFSFDGIYKNDEIIKSVLPHFIGHSFNDINKWISGEISLRSTKEITALWRCMCDRKVIKKNNLYFDTKLSLGEDTKFICQYLSYTESVGILKENLYYLTSRTNGANLSSYNNVEKMIIDKEKLINARNEISNEILESKSINTFDFWQGTLVFSVLQIMIRLSKEENIKRKKKIKLFKSYLDSKGVRDCLQNFHPKFGKKAIPFLLIKITGPIFWLHICLIIPSNMLNKFVPENQ